MDSEIMTWANIISFLGFLLGCINLFLWRSSTQKILMIKQQQLNIQQRQPLSEHRVGVARRSNYLFTGLEVAFGDVLHLLSANLHTVENPHPNRKSSIAIFQSWKSDHDQLIREIFDHEPDFRSLFETEDIVSRSLDGSLFHRLSDVLQGLEDLSQILDGYYDFWHDTRRVSHEETERNVISGAEGKCDNVSQQAFRIISDAKKYYAPILEWVEENEPAKSRRWFLFWRGDQ